MQVTWDKVNGAHPLLWAEAFNLNPETSAEDMLTGTSWVEHIISRQRRYPLNYTVVGLSKLLTYGSFVKSRASALSLTGATMTTIGDVVREEVDNYPYTRRSEFKEPYFRPLDLSGKTNLFREAIQ